MGFFDKKKSTDDDDDEGKAKSEVLPPIAKAKSAPPPPPPATDSELPKKASAPPPPSPPAAVAPPPPLPPPPKVHAAFGIDEAVVLIRSLPARNVDLVMQVVKKTLESVHVDVAAIIDGATAKESDIEKRIVVLKRDIDRLETEIAAARKSIGSLETEQKELSTVKERLTLAQKLEASGGEDKPISDRPIVTERTERTAAPPVKPPPPNPTRT